MRHYEDEGNLATQLRALDLPRPIGVWDRVVTDNARSSHLKPTRFGRWPSSRWVMALGVAVALLVVGGVAAMAGSYREAATATTKPISEREAIAYAMKWLPNNGAGYTVTAVHFEPTSKNFQFVFPDGQGSGEDQVKECLSIPPLPRFLFPSVCRYYPVWLVELSSQGCGVIIDINAFTGRFGGGGTVGKDTTPSTSSPPSPAPPTGCQLGYGGATAPSWWQPMWG